MFVENRKSDQIVELLNTMSKVSKVTQWVLINDEFIIVEVNLQIKECTGVQCYKCVVTLTSDEFIQMWIT